MRFVTLPTLCLGMTLIFATPAVSNSAFDDVESVADKCEQSNCQKVVKQTVRRLRRKADSVEDFNSSLGGLATALVRTISETTDRRSRKRIAAALARVARSSTDAEQRENILKVARKIRKGDDDSIDLDDPFAVSPS
ncbi:MAG: hypothetical protein ACSHXD_09835 [Marinosulfonomonas sp.]